MPLHEQHCQAKQDALSSAETQTLLKQLPGWHIEGQALCKTFEFKNYYATIAFVNALAWIAHREDHHPDLAVHYNRTIVRWSTHDAGGLTLNDFICAARCDQMTEDR